MPGHSWRTGWKGLGASTHPCLTPFKIAKGNEEAPLERTRPVIWSWKRQIRFVNILGHSNSARMVHSASGYGVKRFNVNENRLEIYFSWICLTVKTMLTMLWPGGKPHWVFYKDFSEIVDQPIKNSSCKDLSSNWQKWNASVMPQCVLLPLFLGRFLHRHVCCGTRAIVPGVLCCVGLVSHSTWCCQTLVHLL